MLNIQEITKNIESVSVSYAEKHDISRTNEWFILKLSEEVGELIQSYLKLTGQARSNDVDEHTLKCNFEDEIADVLGQILLLANHHNVDLISAIERKWLAWLPEKSDEAIG